MMSEHTAQHVERWRAGKLRAADVEAIEHYAASIRAVLHYATPYDREEGMGWYDAAHSVCAALGAAYGYPTATVVGVLSALSAGMLWEANVTAAEVLVRHCAAGTPTPDDIARLEPDAHLAVYGWANTVHKAWSIVAARPSTWGGIAPHFTVGSKTHSFARCIWAPDDTGEVAVDSHAANIAVWGAVRVGASRAPSIGNSRKRDLFALGYVDAAMMDGGLTPMQAQAVAWCAYRRVPVKRGEEVEL